LTEAGSLVGLDEPGEKGTVLEVVQLLARMRACDVITDEVMDELARRLIAMCVERALADAVDSMLGYLAGRLTDVAAQAR
jgi:hypothetical protein